MKLKTWSPNLPRCYSVSYDPQNCIARTFVAHVGKLGCLLYVMPNYIVYTEILCDYVGPILDLSK